MGKIEREGGGRRKKKKRGKSVNYSGLCTCKEGAGGKDGPLHLQETDGRERGEKRGEKKMLSMVFKKGGWSRQEKRRKRGGNCARLPALKRISKKEKRGNGPGLDWRGFVFFINQKERNRKKGKRGEREVRSVVDLRE